MKVPFPYGNGTFFVYSALEKLKLFEGIGYIVDRTGFEEFKRWALKNVVLPVKAEVMSSVYWKGIKY